MRRYYTSFVARLPLSGKLKVHQLAFGVYTARDPGEAEMRFRSFARTIVVSHIGHALQLVLVAWALTFPAPSWVRSFFSLYALANILALSVQVPLDLRVRRRYRSGRYARRVHEFKPGPVGDAVFATCFTFGGQIAFNVLLYVFVVRVL
ncbi:MAG TPA: hypothetical protein VD862_03890 [Candidatus Paceibacterota bacterium]|nr:hypothetical protein [Candidatus Paceibacterota bacterium]